MQNRDYLKRKKSWGGLCRTQDYLKCNKSWGGPYRKEITWYATKLEGDHAEQRLPGAKQILRGSMQDRDYLERNKSWGGKAKQRLPGTQQILRGIMQNRDYLNEQILRESMQNENKLLVNQQDNQYSKIFMFFLTRYSKTFMYIMNAWNIILII